MQTCHHPPHSLSQLRYLLRNFAVDDFFPFFPSLDDSVAPPGPSPTPPTTRSETSVVPPVAQLLGPQGRRWSRHGSFKARSSRSTIGPTSHELFNAQGSTRNHRIEPDYSETRVKIFIAILSPSHESRSTTSRPPSARAVAASAICGNRDSREVGDENEQGEHGQSTLWWLGYELPVNAALAWPILNCGRSNAAPCRRLRLIRAGLDALGVHLDALGMAAVEVRHDLPVEALQRFRRLLLGPRVAMLRSVHRRV